MFAFYTVAIVILLGRRRIHRRPANYALGAIVINLSITVVFAVVQVVGTRYMTPQNTATTFGILSLLSNLASIGAFALLLVAVFIDRDVAGRPGYSEYDVGGKPLADQPSDNPYAAPRQ